MFFNPNLKLKYIQSKDEQRAIKSIMDILDSSFGFNYTVAKGTVVEVQLVSVGLALIPRQFGYLPNLYKIQLPSNKIKKLRNIERCSQVKIINLSENLIISDVLGQLKDLPELQALDLSGNQITTLEPLNNLKMLESLNVSNNKILEIPKLSLPMLKYLDLSNNPISELKNLQYLNSLINIKLQNTKLSVEEEILISKSVDELKKYCEEK